MALWRKGLPAHECFDFFPGTAADDSVEKLSLHRKPGRDLLSRNTARNSQGKIHTGFFRHRIKLCLKGISRFKIRHFLNIIIAVMIRFPLVCHEGICGKISALDQQNTQMLGIHQRLIIDSRRPGDLLKHRILRREKADSQHRIPGRKLLKLLIRQSPVIILVENIMVGRPKFLTVDGMIHLTELEAGIPFLGLFGVRILTDFLHEFFIGPPAILHHRVLIDRSGLLPGKTFDFKHVFCSYFFLHHFGQGAGTEGRHQKNHQKNTHRFSDASGALRLPSDKSLCKKPLCVLKMDPSPFSLFLFHISPDAVNGPDLSHLSRRPEGCQKDRQNTEKDRHRQSLRRDGKPDRNLFHPASPVHEMDEIGFDELHAA